jgi:hypothetical protein
MSSSRFGIQKNVCEWGYTSGRSYADPGNDVQVEVRFTAPSGRELIVPAYWAGGVEWRVRFAPDEVGAYRYRSFCSCESDPDLHRQEGTLEVAPYQGENPLLQHGGLRVSTDRRYLEHADGTPFFWLGDTWWMGLTRRLSWPDEFQRLVADRVQKGFSLIQIVAGLYPDMPAYDERGYNEAGHPWEPGYARLNPGYFDMADLRIQWLVRAGLVPCIVGCWGYHLLWLRQDKMKAHWRNLVARYGAYPVVWCLAGEGSMPYYLSEDKERDRERLREGWTDLARYVREIDPHRRPITIHPTRFGRDQVVDDTVLDFDMLQTGHGGYASIGPTAQAVSEAVARRPVMPVVQGEVCYEGIMASSYEDVQHIVFWASILSGAKGFTYGANGLWQLNRPEAPFGTSPHGMAWGDLPWQEAYRLPGSDYVGRAKRFLERYPWWRLESHPEWIEPHAGDDNALLPYAAGIPGELRVIYFPKPPVPWSKPAPELRDLEPDITYRALLYDPKHDRTEELGQVSGVRSWLLPLPPVMLDWVLVLERV